MTKGFPKTHLYLVAFLGLGLCSIGIANFNEQPVAVSAPSEGVAEDVVKNLPIVAEDEGEALLPLESLPPPPEEPAPELRIVEHVVEPGESLGKIFRAVGASSQDLYRISKSEPHGKRLSRIYPGHRLSFAFDESEQMQQFSYTPGPLQTLRFNRAGDSFEAEELIREPEKVTEFASATIDSNLFLASQRAGLSDGLTMELAHIFQWDIDFVLDIREGDSFNVLYEDEYLDGERIGHGDILAAEFINQGEAYRAVLYEDAQGRRSYYDPEGRNMRKAFLRAPVEFSRISSHFNLRRKHPLHKRSMPHRGIDYAASTGTPILAAGDGRISKATRTKPNGNFVIINHGEQFQTKYLHLSRFARGVKAGTKVKQGQVIGYVGSTGWATGPHLHYEFLVNGVHQNPRTVKLPDAEPITSNERARFQEHAKPIFTELSAHQTRTTSIASAR